MIFFSINFLVLILIGASAKSKVMPHAIGKVEENKVNAGGSLKITKPNLEKDEYAIFIEDRYIKFKTRVFEGLELTSVCFKSKLPKCEAYEFSQIKPKHIVIKNEGLNNVAAIACEALYGKNLLALDFNKNEYNFCRFPDGSMVNSWSVYQKYFSNN